MAYEKVQGPYCSYSFHVSGTSLHGKCFGIYMALEMPHLAQVSGQEYAKMTSGVETSVTDWLALVYQNRDTTMKVDLGYKNVYEDPTIS